MVVKHTVTQLGQPNTASFNVLVLIAVRIKGWGKETSVSLSTKIGRRKFTVQGKSKKIENALQPVCKKKFS